MNIINYCLEANCLPQTLINISIIYNVYNETVMGEITETNDTSFNHSCINNRLAQMKLLLGY